MSATGRNHIPRVAGDDYPTPTWCVHRLLDRMQFLLKSRDQIWFEPASGSGNIINAVQSYVSNRPGLYYPEWHAMDINPYHTAVLDTETHVSSVTTANFLECKINIQPDVIITNPPYSHAMEFLQRCMEYDPTFIIMLLRTNFLASEKRNAFLQSHVPDMYQLPNRPTFAHGGTDNTEYSWFVWHGNDIRYEGELFLLDTTPISERKGK